MTSLGTPARRVVAVLVLVLVLVALARLVVAPLVRSIDERHETVAQLERELVTLRRVSASRVPTRKRLAQLEQRRQAEGIAFTAPNASLAAGMLQELLNRRVAEAGARLSSIQVLPAEQQDGYFRMTARVNINATPETLGPVLHALETGLPYLVVDKLSINSRGRRRKTVSATHAPLLTVSLEATGFLSITSPEGG